MSAETKEIAKLQAGIKEDLKDILEKNLKISDWDIPEADDKELATKIVDILQEALNELKKEVQEGAYNNY